MNESWAEHGCAEIKAHYTFYPVPVAAALWCGIPEGQVQEELARCIAVKDAVLRHPTIECIEFRCRAIHDAIQNGELAVARENGVRATDYVRPDRRHVYLLELKAWMAEKFPTDKPPLLFDEIERGLHPHITVDSFREINSDRDSLKIKNALLSDEVEKLRKEKEVLLSEKGRLVEELKHQIKIDPRARSAYLTLIWSLSALMVDEKEPDKLIPVFKSRAKLNEALVDQYDHLPGIAKRTIEDKFAEANALVASLR